MNASDLKRGIVIKLNEAPCSIIDTTSQSPSARGGTTLIKAKYRNLLTGQVLVETLKSSDRVFEADFARRKGQFLYADGDNGVFMDLESYEQFEVGGEVYDAVKGYLLDGTELTLGVYNEQVVSLEPAMVVELLVTETAPAIKNATAQAQTKEATLETGISIQVPSYLESGERIKVDTRECRFVSRA
jgi:elongation factor P